MDSSFRLKALENPPHEELRNKILASLRSQGFVVAPVLKPKHSEKDTLRRIHRAKRLEQLKLHKGAIKQYFPLARKYALNGQDLAPDEIKLELRLVEPDSELSNLFLWWNLVWWSLPYEHPVGRYMRFVLWDTTHDAPFGLLGLQSPPLRSKVRDQFLGLKNGTLDYWINQSMYAQRVGALPPYNQLLGAKMVALSILSNEIRDLYAAKYAIKTILRHRRLPSRLLFVTTTSAYGKSSIYERLHYEKRRVSEFVGFTSGSGTFHLTETLYGEMLGMLAERGIDVKRGYGTGPSRKLKLVDRAFGILEIPEFAFHNIKRGCYLFPNVANLQAVLHSRGKPQWFDRPFSSLAEYWKNRWCVPRSTRYPTWKDFDARKFLNSSASMLSRL